MHKIKNRVLAKSLHPIFFIFLLVGQSFAQNFNYGKDMQQAYIQTLQLNYASAKALTQKQLSNNGIAIYIENFRIILPIFILEDRDAYEKYSYLEEEYLKSIQALGATSPYYYFTQGEIKLHWALLKLKFGDNASAALNFRSAYKIIEEGLEKYPNHVPLLKTMALLKIACGAIPPNYKWLIKLVGLEGDIPYGIHQLENIANSKHLYAQEALMWLVLCKHYLLSDTENDNELNLLSKNAINSPLIQFIVISSTMHEANTEIAFALFKKTPLNYFTQIPGFYYLLGEAHIHKGEYHLAIKHFKNYLVSFKGKAYIKDAAFKIYISNLLLHEYKEAQVFKEYALSHGDIRNDSDKQAQYLLTTTQFPHSRIFEIRYLTDGGYLSQALSIVNQTPDTYFENEWDVYEYQYRKARIYHKLGNIELAILYYDKTIATHFENKEYFAPNACLQMGYIYKNLNQNAKAKIYFNNVFHYSDYEYQSTIESKAKAALSTL